MKALLVGAGMLALAACSSQPALVAPLPPTTYRTIGTVRGAGCGLLFAGILPIYVNGRTERAYREALSKGGRQLVDTKIQYRWYVIPYGGTLLCTFVEGTAVE